LVNEGVIGRAHKPRERVGRGEELKFSRGMYEVKVKKGSFQQLLPSYFGFFRTAMLGDERSI
jgi:hypothetical protein